MRPKRGAQRLAASMEDSRVAGQVEHLNFKCSTPCGINGRFTWLRLEGRSSDLPVLNALRHQWKIHGAGFWRNECRYLRSGLRVCRGGCVKVELAGCPRAGATGLTGWAA